MFRTRRQGDLRHTLVTFCADDNTELLSQPNEIAFLKN